MKLKFTTEKSVNGVRVVAVDVKAAVRGNDFVESEVKSIYYHRKDPWNFITDEIPTKIVDNVEYFDC